MQKEKIFFETNIEFTKKEDKKMGFQTKGEKKVMTCPFIIDLNRVVHFEMYFDGEQSLLNKDRTHVSLDTGIDICILTPYEDFKNVMKNNFKLV